MQEVGPKNGQKINLVSGHLHPLAPMCRLLQITPKGNQRPTCRKFCLIQVT